VTTYRVGFDGRWQDTFDYEDEAVEWAKEVADADRVVFVVEQRLLRSKLIAVFPESEAATWRDVWNKMGRSDWAGNVIPPLAPPGF
jgi:hypothetical protein